MKYLCQLLLWSFLGTAFEWVCAQNAERFVNEIMSDYRTVDQVGRADTSRDGYVSHQEFALSLYQKADIEGNNDNGVTMNEFVDHYVKHYNISSELAIFMFNLLNDPANQDNKITPNDITLRSFLGRDYASIKEYRDALQKWVTQAANQLYNVLTSPHVIDQSNDLSPRYDILLNVDTNGDGVISNQELEEEFRKFLPNQDGVRVNRNSWIERNVHSYGADPVTSILTFDYWDRNGNLVITPSDLQVAMLDLDRNGDGRITWEEYLQYFERGYKLSRRISGKSIQSPKRACPVPWWSNLRASPSVDATRAAMDFDEDFDGWVSVENIRRWLMIFDTDGDGYLNRNEYIDQQSSRYGVNSTIASSMFDLADTSGDDRIGEDDWMNHVKDRVEISFCDARRSILDLTRMAEKFHNIPQASVKRSSMQESLKEEWAWFLQNEQVSGWMALNPYANGNNYPHSGLCKGNAACYEGEHTKAWALPGASLWWIRGISSGFPSSIDNMAGMTGGPLFAEVLPAVLMGGPLPYKRATDSPKSQIQSPEQIPRQISGLGMSSLSQPSRNNNNFPFGGGTFGRYPNRNDNDNNNGQIMSNPLMKQYHRLFNQQSSYSPHRSGGVTNPMNLGTNDRTGSGSNFQFGSQHSTETQTPSFGPLHRDESNFRTPIQGQNIRPTAQPWSPSENNADANPGSLGNFPMQNRLPQNSQLPFIGLSAYPLVLSLDPSSSMLWRTMTRRRKALSRKKDVLIDNKANTMDETQIDLNQRRRRDAGMEIENENTNSQINDTDIDLRNIPWNPMFTGFHPTPLDIWMSWALEKFIWENDNTDSNGTVDRNGSREELNDLESLWSEMDESNEGEAIREINSKDPMANSREKRNTEGDELSAASDDRHKRWILYVRRLRRNPYLYAMRNLWPRYYCSPPLNFFYMRYRVRSPFFWYPCYMYNMFPWWRGMMFPYRTWMVKRSRRDTAETEISKGEINMKRAFSFDNWFNNKADKTKQFNKPNNDRYFAQRPSSTNAWKSVENSKYGMKNNWGQEESRQWGTSTKETYDYNSNGKWRNNNQLPNHRYNAYSTSTPYSGIGGRHPTFRGPNRQWEAAQFNSPHNADSMYWMDPYREGPGSFSAFLMPSLIGMSWKKRKTENGQYNQRYLDRMNDRFKQSMAGHMHQTNGFSSYSDRLQNTMRNNPWEVGYNPSGFPGMFDQSPFMMWPRRLVRKSKDEIDNVKETDQVDTGMHHNKRSRRSAKDVDKARSSDIKEFFKKFNNKKKASVRVTSWMPWESWHMLKIRMEDNGVSQNTISSNKKVVKLSNSRHKRSTNKEDPERTKRWGFDNAMWSGNGWYWNQWMNHQWKRPWYNNYMRFSRESDDTDINNDLSRENRETNEMGPREKRWGMWNMMNPWSPQGNWGNRWYPWNNWHSWNYMRYPRQSDDDRTNGDASRIKRDVEDNDRFKRWGFYNPVFYSNGWNWNNWMNYRWYPWYNNYMRFSRESDDTDTNNENVNIEKRETGEEIPREKRWGMWNMMYPWSRQGHRNGMWNMWNPWNNWSSWNYMRYPRQSDKTARDETLTEGSRPKRNVDEDSRTKRYGMWNNPMWSGNGWGWNQMMNHQWNRPWYNNYMRFSRESDDTDVKNDLSREKRDTNEMGPRGKRWGMWNMVNPWSPQGNWGNRWYPWYNFHSWNYMRYPRQSDDDKTNADASRIKRDVEDTDRFKRWGFYNPMSYSNGWNWNNWMNYRWYPWYNNYMRFARESDQSVNEDGEVLDREKREADQENTREKRYGMWNNPMWSGNGWYWNQWMNYQWNRPWYNNYMRFGRESDDTEINNENVNIEKRETGEIPREKRWGMWNMMNPWSEQGHRNGMWNMWNPWNNWSSWNYMRYPRQSGKTALDETFTDASRPKRNVEEDSRTKRYGMWNSPMWSRNGWGWNQWMNHQWHRPWYNNYIRFSRESDDTGTNKNYLSRQKREIEDTGPREKRWGTWNMMYPWSGQRNWNSWYPWNNWYPWNYMRYPRESGKDMIKTKESRARRDAEENGRTKRWGFGTPWSNGNSWNMNQWMNHRWTQPWYDNYMRFARDVDSTTTSGHDKTRMKREAFNENTRERRWGLWNMMYPWSGNGHWNSWYPWNNWHSWNYMRYPRQSDDDQTNADASRIKRDVKDTDRFKRWGFYNPMSYSNGWNWNNWMNYRWYPWYNNYMRFARESDQSVNEDGEDLDREKREADQENTRDKRYGMWNNPMWSGNGWYWNQWMNYQWNRPWYNNYMRFGRESDDTEINNENVNIEKRETGEETPREKRWGMWNMMYPWSRQGNWNGMWNMWNPWNNWSSWNYVRYPRQSGKSARDETLTEASRTKRNVDEDSRTKRYGMWNNPMWSGNGWGWNQWMNHQWNRPWYNNFMRFARESDDTDINNDLSREKRETNEMDLRGKRWGMWNTMNPWSPQGNWGHRWYPWYNWHSWNYMRYPRQSVDDKTNADASRIKRDVKDTDRFKRWGFYNPMSYSNGWNWNNWMNYRWYPWYNNYMRFARESDQSVNEDGEDLDREKREADQENTREKRYGMWNNPMCSGNGWYWNQWMNYHWNRPWYNNYMRFGRESDDTEINNENVNIEKRETGEETPREKRWGMWNMMYPWSRQGHWNGMWNMWNPWNNWSSWNYMRYPRQSDKTARDETLTEGSRPKRNVDQDSRTKRYGMWNNPMWSGNGWYWNQWMDNQWNRPRYNNYMRFARESDDTDINNDLSREKRETNEMDLRGKRWGMWNIMNPWSTQGNWGNRWYPWYNWHSWNYMRYPRQSVDDKTNADASRIKRDVKDTDRFKRWGFYNPMFYSNGWNWNNWMNYRWYPWYNNYMRFDRESDQSVNEDGEGLDREKREADQENTREKRYGMWNNPMWSGNGWYWNQWMDNQWNRPWYNNYMRFGRESDDTEINNENVNIEKRETGEETPREKRWEMGNMMYPWSRQGHWNGMWNVWNPWNNWSSWNYVRYPRQSSKTALDETLTEASRTKRNVDEDSRTKRYGMWNNPMWSRNGWYWNQWMNYQWNRPWYNYMRFSRESDDTDINNDLSREKRETNEMGPREKRWGMWNMMNPWSTQGNKGNRWYPWHSWNYMRDPRQSDDDKTTGDASRIKRDVEDTDRFKRWGFYNPMSYSNGWNWNNWMNYRWYPWYNNYMRFARESDQGVNRDEAVLGREKRNTEQKITREKRYGMWNNPMWSGRGWYWNNWMNYQWNRPWYNNFMRFGRDTVREKNSLRNTVRRKRDATKGELKEVADFTKRQVAMNKKAFSPGFGNGKFGSNNDKTMRGPGQNNEKILSKPSGNTWMDEPRINQEDGNAWSTKWRRWMGRDWSGGSEGRHNQPWFGPRSPWMWFREQWGNPMMSNGHPWSQSWEWW